MAKAASRLALLAGCLLVAGEHPAVAGCSPVGVRVIDGDTVVTDRGERVRIASIDAPEIHAACREERALAYAARDALDALLRGRAMICPTGRDRYGRTLARVETTDGRDAGQWLVTMGLARQWQARPPAGERGSRWCPR